MRLSQFFLPTLKEDPKEAQIVSHRLMLRAGMIQQSSAGIYSWLPLGHRVLKNIENIVREEQNRAGALEILMPTLQPADLWRESGRYDDYGKEMLRITDRHDRDMLYGPTNEEQVTDIFRSHVKSYKNLPLNLYHIQWKFRDEVRPRFGIMRGREFLMKDAYSFDLDYEGSKIAYNNMFVAYLKTFARLGIKAIPLRADTGPIGGDLSHEFIVLADTGESEVFYHKDLLTLDTPTEAAYSPDQLQSIVDEWTGYYAAADDMHDAATCDVAAGDLITRRGIEVGHIFHFGDKYSKAMGASVAGPDGKETLVSMGSYGIGVSRLVGGIIEASHDENGIVWPASVAPFDVGLINLKSGDDACDAACEDFYGKLISAGADVLYDETSGRAGEKFAKMDLIGLPWQATIGPRGVKAGVVEVKNRASGDKQELSLDDALQLLVG
ncbi:MAG: proline--tRNA ligase [Sneathiella sp.]|uniref:proline--tRNA ligase n=1 Tax=Sneathiella sp. TaxID=1964365 RepID=UPI0030039659